MECYVINGQWDILPKTDFSAIPVFHCTSWKTIQYLRLSKNIVKELLATPSIWNVECSILYKVTFGLGKMMISEKVSPANKHPNIWIGRPYAYMALLTLLLYSQVLSWHGRCQGFFASYETKFSPMHRCAEQPEIWKWNRNTVRYSLR